MNDSARLIPPVKYSPDVVAIVLGGSDTVWKDFQLARDMVEDVGMSWVLVATNTAGTEYPGHIDHWATYHQELMPHWIDVRRKNKRDGRVVTGNARFYWTIQRNLRSPVNDIDWYWVEPWGGSSGMIGAQVGMRVCDRVLLCGVPLTADKHYQRKEAWTEAVAHRHAWVSHQADLREKTRSLGGWTADLIGLPTEEWLLEGVGG